MSELVCVAKFDHSADAEAARGLLETMGIEATVTTEERGSMPPAVGANHACLMVRPEDESTAREALEEDIEPENLRKGKKGNQP